MELKDPEIVFLDEAIAVIKAINARTAVLLAEYEHFKKAIANEPQPDAEKAGEKGGTS
jgi:hypothetical protein